MERSVYSTRVVFLPRCLVQGKLVRRLLYVASNDMLPCFSCPRRIFNTFCTASGVLKETTTKRDFITPLLASCRRC
jgi:hypothetical protein